MEIRIAKKDADYIWYTLKIKDNPRPDNTDDQFSCDGRYYYLYDYDNVVIKAYFEIKDGNAAMDSNDFCDWDNYDELCIVSDGTVIDN